MSIRIYILVLVILVIIGFIIGYLLDFLLAKGVFRLIIWKEKDRLDPDKLKPTFQKIMENRRQKWAFKTYLGALITLFGAGGIIPFHKAELLVDNGKRMINFQLLVDNVPSWLLMIGLILCTIAYFTYMYFSNKKYKTEILSSAAKVINEQFLFIPTQDWFKDKSELHLKNLGKTFDLNINFKYDFFEDAFASTCRDGRLARCFQKEKMDLLKTFGYTKSHFENKLGDDTTQRIEDNIKTIAEGISFKTIQNNTIQIIEKAINNINYIFLNAIRSKIIKYTDYDYSRIHSALEDIRIHIHKPWIQSINGQSLIVYGEGGMGKTHLLAKIVQRRLEEHLPTIFFLGRIITDTGIPMEQILNTLDLKCKKETFFHALNEYGKKHGRVVLVVDGINEGVGLSFWKNHLLNFINELQSYQNIGLIISVRTHENNGWIDNFIREENIPSFNQQGFELNVSGAVEYMFKSFSIPLPTWPIRIQEFRNPLMLTLFCRSHQGETTPPKHETRLEIIENYIRHFNERLASRFQYTTSVNVLRDVLHRIAIYMIEKGNRWKLSQIELLTILGQHQIIGTKADIFLDALLDEGLLSEYYFVKNNPSYTFGYDTMGGYLIASTMVENNNINGILLQDVVILEALTDLLPAKKDKELFEVLKDEDTGFSLMNMFLKSLSTRTYLTAGGRAFLQSLYDKRQLVDMFEVIARVPFNNDWPLNATVLDSLLKPMRLVDRDAVWTVNISDNTYLKEQISTLVAWARSASQEIILHLDKDILLHISRLLIWTLATTDKALRNRTTRALINLLQNDDDCLLQCIRDYHNVNDDYIVERLFAIAFGCCTSSQEKGFVEKVAQLTYDCVFKEGQPRENILVRDFAKNIIDYAVSLHCNLDLEKEKITPPYSKEKKNISITTEEIKKYELNYEDTPDKELYLAQTNILESMRTEYSPRGLYGDFGRYTFQAALDIWNDNIELISNYAIKLIFEELGYKASLFKRFDGKTSSRLRLPNEIERIGKKYQWIAMYRVAAILVDNHYGEPYDRNWFIPIDLSVRNFDPTICLHPNTQEYTATLPVYKIPKYDLHKESDEKWLRNWKKMPNIKEYIEYETNGTKWIDLYSYYTISSDSNYNKIAMEGKSGREIWTFLQAFLVAKSDRKKLCNRIHKEGLRGRRSTENSAVYSIYYREYYWSSHYHKEIEDTGRTSCNFEIGNINTGINVQPSYLLYTPNEYSDIDSDTTPSEIIMPSPYLYEGLKMHFSANDGIWLTEDDNVACFDNAWVHGEHGGLFIRKDFLMDYLKRKNMNIIWTVLMERTYKQSSNDWPRLHAGGYVWMDETGHFHHKFRSYEETLKDKAKRKFKQFIKKSIRQKKSFSYNQEKLQQVSYESLLQMMEDEQKRQNES